MQRVISKEDFNAMEVIGQFNLGFIITRLDQVLCRAELCCDVCACESFVFTLPSLCVAGRVYHRPTRK
jgi:hypothetical protein